MLTAYPRGELAEESSPESYHILRVSVLDPYINAEMFMRGYTRTCGVI